MTKVRLTLIASMILASGAAMAQSAKEPANYVGASLALYNKYNLSCESGLNCKNNPKQAGKIFAGHQFDGWGLEGMLFTTGTAKAQFKEGLINATASSKQSGLGVYAVLPVTTGDFTLKGKLGVSYVRSNYSAQADVATEKFSESSSKSSFQPLIGAGVSYAVSREVSLHADWDRIRGNNGLGKLTTNMVSVGVSYKF